MTEEYAHIQKENDILRNQLMNLQNERDNAVQNINGLESIVRSKDKHIEQLEQELESSINENIKMYEAMSSKSLEKQDEAMIIGLESKNQQLREVIAFLYSNYQQDKKEWAKRIHKLESSRHSIDNHERADLSELCGQYKTEIESLRTKLCECAAQVSSEELVASLQAEKEQQQELLRLNQELIDEYDIMVEESSRDLATKEEKLTALAQSLQTVALERQQLQEQVEDCMLKIHQYEKQEVFRNSQNMEYSQFHSSHQNSLLESKSRECESLQTQLRIKELELQAKAWENQQIVECIPPSGVAYVEKCTGYSELLLLSQIAGTIIHSVLEKISHHTLSVPLSLFSAYYDCLMVIARSATIAKQLLLVLENPYVKSKQFTEIVSICASSVQFLYHFSADFVVWENGSETSNPAWVVPKEAKAALNRLHAFLLEHAYKGDCMWERAINAANANGTCIETQLSICLIETLLKTQIHTLKPQEINNTLAAGMIALSDLVTTCSNTVSVLSQKLQGLQRRIVEDGFLGIPRLAMEPTDPILKERSQLQCENHMQLWTLIETLHKEWESVKKHCFRLAEPSKSLLEELIADCSDEGLLTAVIQECQLERKKSVMAVMSHFAKNLHTVTSANLFITAVSNPSRLEPESSSVLLTSEGSTLRQQFESSVSHSVQQQMEALQQQATADTARIQRLERDVLEQTTARLQLQQKLESRESIESSQESLEEIRTLQNALKKKEGECREYKKETMQLKKEITELRSQSSQNSAQLAGTQRGSRQFYHKLQERAIRCQLAELPTIQHKTRTVMAGLPLSVKPSLLREALQAKVVDLATCTPSVKKDLIKINDYFGKVAEMVSVRDDMCFKGPTESSILASTITLPADIAHSIFKEAPSSINILVNSTTVKSIHDSIL